MCEQGDSSPERADEQENSMSISRHTDSRTASGNPYAFLRARKKHFISQ